MIAVRVNDKKADEIMSIVKELRAQGLVQGKQFDFKYIPGNYDAGGFWCYPFADFKFHTGHEKYATLFAIKYGN